MKLASFSSPRVGSWLLLGAVSLTGACGGSSNEPVKAPVAAVSAPPVATAPPFVDPEPFRAKQPALGAPKPFTPPAATTKTLANGLRILVIERHEVPIAAFELVVDHGAEQTTRGLAPFVAEMLDAGTESRSANELADAWKALGASHRARASVDALSLSGAGLVEKLPAMLDLAADMLLKPRFLESEIGSLKKRRKATIAAERASDGSLADIVANEEMYGKAHPLGGSFWGTEAIVDGIQRADLVAYMKAHVAPNRATLVVAGDVTLDQVEAFAKKPLGRWAGKIDAPVAVPMAPVAAAGKAPRIVLLDRPTANQSEVRISDVGVPRGHADFAKVQVMLTVLGGTFSSRLNHNLREIHGYTYGAFAYADARRDLGTLDASAAVVKDKTAPAVKELFSELQRIRDELVTPEELESAKRTLALNIPTTFESTSAVAGSFAGIAVLGLPLDEFRRQQERWQAVTREDVQRIARTFIVPERVRIIVVGDAKTVRAPLEEAGFGPIEVRALADAPKPARK